MTMLETLLLIVVLGVVTLAALEVLTGRRLASLSAAVEPLRTLLPATHEALARALDAQREAVRQLPQAISETVSAEVRGGLEPLRLEMTAVGTLAASLAASHDHFTQAVLTLNNDGSLAEWVGGFREAVQPFEQVSSALARHYDTAGQVLRTTSGLLEQWAVQRDAVVHTFEQFAEVVERSAAADTTHLRDIEHRVMNRLEEVAETHALVAHALSELQTAGRHALETQTQLAGAVEKTVQEVHELVELGRQTQGQHLELVRAQQQVQQELGQWQREAAAGLATLQAGVGQVGEATAQALERMRQGTQSAVADLRELLKDLQLVQARGLQELRERQEEAARHQTDLAGRQERWLAGAQAMLAGLPTRRYQMVSLALLAAQIMAVLLLGAWLHR
jgi:hypothetical protein